MILASIPSPTRAVWNLDLGFVTLPIRAYALCIIAGIVVACVVTDRRMRSRGAPPWAVLDVAMWAVPFGIIGARLYHVFSSPDNYFGHGWDGVVAATKIWEGGLGIWGGVAGGALGAWLACRQLGISFTLVADCIAVGLPLAQAVGRLGNWFNNELHGGPTTLPWGLEVHTLSQDGVATGTLDGLYHPTFLYELLWNVGVAVLVIVLDRRFRFGKGRAFALYVMAYTAGRAWIEMMRTDDAEMVGGLRLNVWTSLVVFLAALAYFLLRKGPQEFLVPVAEGRGFQTVTEEQFRAFQADGTRPHADAGEAETSGVTAGEAPAAGEPEAEAGAAKDEPDVATTAKD